MSLSVSEFQAALDAVTTSFGRQCLLDYATRNGEPFLSMHETKFPTATTAKEQPKTKTHMNATLTITADPAVLEAINNLASAIRSKAPCEPVFDTELAKRQLEVPLSPTPTVEQEESPAPKKRRTKVASPEPVEIPEEPVNEEPANEEPEPPTGAELRDEVGPMKNSPYSKRLRKYMDEELGLTDKKLQDVTDIGHRAKLHAKIQELLAEKARADEDEV